MLLLLLLLTFWFVSVSFPSLSLGLWAAEVDLKPGDTITLATLQTVMRGGATR
jgi:hypothetical protein